LPLIAKNKGKRPTQLKNHKSNFGKDKKSRIAEIKQRLKG
jgi:hypothetical protein